MLDEYTYVQSLSYIKNCFKFPCAVSVNGVAFGEVSSKYETVIVNKGDAETGCLITLHASYSISAPIRITNYLNGQYFELNTDMVRNDVIVINTNIGEKSVMLYRDGEEINLFSQISDDSSWLQLCPGENIFTSVSGIYDTPMLDVDISNVAEYIGV